MAAPDDGETHQYSFSKESGVAQETVPHASLQKRPYGIYAFVAAIRERPKVFGWCLYACYCSLVVAFESVATGSSTSIPKFRKDFGYPFAGGYVLDARWQAAFDAGPRVSSVIATLCQGTLADKFGRRAMFMGSLVVSFTAYSFEVAAESKALFFCGRVLNGITLGVSTATAMTYSSEIISLPLRGFIPCFNALMIAVGPFTATAIIDQTQDLNSHWAYKAVFTAQFGVAGAAAVLVWFVPESPVWLMRIGNVSKARRSLSRLGYTQTLEIDTEIFRIRAALDKEIKDCGEGTSYLECFRNSDLRRTIISVMPLAIQALGGQFFFAFYFAYYSQLVGYSVHESFRLQFIQYAFVIFANVCSWYLVERLGRRTLSICGTFALTVVMMLCGGLGMSSSPTAIKGTVATFILYGFFFNIGIGATGFILLCEVASYRLRGKTIALGISLQHLINLVWAFVVPVMVNPDHANMGAKAVFVFGGLNMLCLIYLWYYQVETRGRSFQELDELFSKGIGVRDFGGYVTDARRH
ncbi:general substrate transporter [Diaporthe sp. PMI_573]|nr:general substrate transporter [Diaporthaceae sp. PMI_573]